MTVDHTEAPPRPTDEPFGAWGHGPHDHDFHQLLFAPVGAAVVTAAGGAHRITPEVALWVPAGVVHEARFAPDCLVEAVGFATDVFRLPHPRCTEVAVTAQRRSLLLAHLRGRFDDVEPDHALFDALLDGPPLLPLPHPRSPIPAAVAAALLADPRDDRDLEAWARQLHTSTTTIRRGFASETGLALSEWRTRARLNASIEPLFRGRMVSAVAQSVGFSSTNGFIVAFRRHFGTTPAAYVRRSGPAPRP